MSGVVGNIASNAVYQDTFGANNNLGATINSEFVYVNRLGMNSIALNLTIPSGATVVFEGSFNGETYNSVILRRVANDGYVNSTTVSDVYIGSISGMRKFRVRVSVAGSSAGTVIGNANSGVNTLEGIENGPPNDFELNLAESKVAYHTLVNKFGRNTDIDTATTPEDVWNGGGLYTGQPSSGNAETVEVFSGSANDTSAGTGARTIQIDGLDANYALQSESLTMNGVTPVSSVNTWRRVFTAFVLTAGSGGANASTITCRHTTTTSNIFFVMPIGKNRTHVAAYTIPAGKTGYLRKFYCTMNRGAGATFDRDADIDLMVRAFGQVYQSRRPMGITSGYDIDENIYGGLPFTEKTDLVMRVFNVSQNDSDISGGFDLILVDN